MRIPKFTDSAKWRVPYVRSGHTDIRRTFSRIRREQQQIEAERAEKVTQLSNILKRGGK